MFFHEFINTKWLTIFLSDDIILSLNIYTVLLFLNFYTSVKII